MGKKNKQPEDNSATYYDDSYGFIPPPPPGYSPENAVHIDVPLEHDIGIIPPPPSSDYSDTLSPSSSSQMPQQPPGMGPRQPSWPAPDTPGAGGGLPGGLPLPPSGAGGLPLPPSADPMFPVK